MKNVLDFITENWVILTPIIYEVGARVTPTKRNLSLLDTVVKLIGFVLKNRRKPDIDDETPDTIPKIKTIFWSIVISILYKTFKSQDFYE